jgi:GNAT superfamily N-acetyltransferase
MDVTIRQAAEPDSETLGALFEGADRQNYARAPHVYKPPESPARSLDYLTRAIAGGPSSLLVVERGGTVLGMARVAVMPVPSSPDGAVAQVGYLYIDGSVRRQGVGGALMRGCHDWIRDHGAPRAQLRVIGENTGAKAFYRRLGYEPLYMEMVGSPDPR